MESLHAGKSLKSGVILGLDDNWWEHSRDGLSAVVRALKTHHQMNVRAVSERLSGHLCSGTRSNDLRTLNRASIMRVKQGRGLLTISGTRHDLDQGDWAYLPAGPSFDFEATLITPTDTQFWVAAIEVA